MFPIVKFVCVLALVFVAPFSQALPPPQPTHVLLDLLVLPNGDMLLRHSHGVFRRSWSDTGWQQVVEAREISPLLVRQNEIYAPARDALYLSIDYGATWAKREAHQINAIGDDGTLYGCKVQGEDSSKDQGLTWQLLGRDEAVPPNHPLWCASLKRTARHKEHEYAVGRDNRLYYKSGPGEHWITRPVEKHFSANEIFTGLHVDRNGILYLNVTTVDPQDANAYWPEKIYLSRDKGEQWAAISWDASPVKPIDPRMWGVWTNTLLMTCAMPGRKHVRHICEASDSNPNSLVFKGEVPSGNLIVAPDGAIYSLDQNDLHRLGRGDKNWQKLKLEGVPDGFGRPRH